MSSSPADPKAVAAWLEGQGITVASPLTVDQIAGGRSNLTYRLTDADGARWVLRRPPTGHVLATAHDMGREYRVITALHGTEVPVPVTYALCGDAAVTGAPFYVMQRVDGTAYRRAPRKRCAAICRSPTCCCRARPISAPT